jgi:SAM-dependent methyltransferase
MGAWWETYFEADGWQGVQLGIDADFDEPAQAEIIERALTLEPGSRVLDVPTGTGRIAIELAARGHHVTGIDLTERFLEAGRERAATRGVEVDLRHGDMRAIDVEHGSFDAALCFWGSFGYFDPAGDASFVRGVAAALRPGGRFLIDTHSVESILPNFRDRGWWETGDLLVLMETEYVVGTGRIETDWTIVGPDGRRERQRSSVRLYALAELTALLEDAGFTSFEARDDELEPFELGSHRLWLVATKG